MIVISFVGGLMSCGGGSTTSSDSSSTLLSTVPTPTWGSLTVNVATNTETSTTTSSALMALSASNPSRPGVPLKNNKLNIENIRMAIRDVEFRASGNRNAKPGLRGPFVINLVQDGDIVDDTFPSMGQVSAVSAEYDSVSFRFDRLDGNRLPNGITDNHTLDGELIGHSLVIEGSFQESEIDINGDGETDSWIDFLYIGDSAEKIRINRDSPIASLTTDSNNYIFITFRIERWFANSLMALQEIDPDLYDEEINEDEVLVIYDERRDGNDLLDLAREMERSIEQSFGFARSEDDRFDFEEDDYDDDNERYRSRSDFEEDDRDDICYFNDFEDWDEDCLDEKESCVEECFEDISCWEDAHDRDDEDGFMTCEDEVERCEDRCWEED